MEKQVYINGKLYPKDQAAISVFDHGLLYGDGVFEGIKSYDGEVFKLDEHLKRLYESAHYLQIEIPMTLEQLREETLNLLSLNGFNEGIGYVRLVVTRGGGDLGINPRKCKGGATVIIIADTIALYPEELYRRGIEAVVCSTRKTAIQALVPRAKSLNYLNNILGIIEANNFGASEGIMLTCEGFVSEATVDNIFVVKNGTLKTPAIYLGILEGITRNSVMEIARDQGIDVQETEMTVFDIYNADELFLSGTAAEIIPVVMVDKRVIGDGKPGKMTFMLRDKFKGYVKRHGTPVPKVAQPVST